MTIIGFFEIFPINKVRYWEQKQGHESALPSSRQAAEGAARAKISVLFLVLWQTEVHKSKYFLGI